MDGSGRSGKQGWNRSRSRSPSHHCGSAVDTRTRSGARVRLGSGFFGAGSSTTAEFRRQVSDLRTILAEGGRDPIAFPVAKRVYVHVDEDRAHAQRLVTEGLAQIYDHVGADLTPVAVFGDPEACVQGVREVIDAGAEMILFTPLHDEAAQMERVAAQVVPHVS